MLFAWRNERVSEKRDELPPLHVVPPLQAEWGSRRGSDPAAAPQTSSSGRGEQTPQLLLSVSSRPAARSRRWVELPVEEQRAHVMRLLDALEVTDRDKRLKVARAILYLAQGEGGSERTPPSVEAHSVVEACPPALRSTQGCLMSATPRRTSSIGPDTTSSCSTIWESSPRCWSCSAWRLSE